MHDTYLGLPWSQACRASWPDARLAHDTGWAQFRASCLDFHGSLASLSCQGCGRNYTFRGRVAGLILFCPLVVFTCFCCYTLTRTGLCHLPRANHVRGRSRACRHLGFYRRRPAHLSSSQRSRRPILPCRFTGHDSAGLVRRSQFFLFGLRSQPRLAKCV